MNTRQGSLMVDLFGGFMALGLISLVALGVAAERRHQVRQEHRTAALDLAQNLLAAGRRGDALPEKAGWTYTRRVLANGVIVLRVHSREVSLSTLLPAAAAGGQP